MIPFVAVVSLRNRQSRTFRMWIPLILIWLLFLPLFVLLSPLICIVWQILRALRKTEFELDQPSTGVSVCIY
jgi:uncharacterized membrane protein